MNQNKMIHIIIKLIEHFLNPVLTPSQRYQMSQKIFLMLIKCTFENMKRGHLASCLLREGSLSLCLLELSQKPRNSRYTAGYRETFRFHVNGNQSAGCSQFFFYPTLWNITAFYLRGRNIIYELARFITTLPPFGWI